MSRDTLTVIDNRTGRSCELAIRDGAVRAEDLRQIAVDGGEGLVSFDPGLTNTASCRSSITHVDGEAGILRHRGYRIEALCEHSTFLEVAYLLIYGDLPRAVQLEWWMHEVTTHNFVHENVKSFMQGFRYDARPMAMLAASVGALSSFYADADEVDDPRASLVSVISVDFAAPRCSVNARAASAGFAQAATTAVKRRTAAAGLCER